MTFASDSSWLGQAFPQDRGRVQTEFERRAPEFMRDLLRKSETVALAYATRFERQRIDPPAWDHDTIDGETPTQRWASYSRDLLVGAFQFESLLSLKGAAAPTFAFQSDIERGLLISISTEGWDRMTYGAPGPCMWRAAFSFERVYAIGWNGDGEIVGALSFGDAWPTPRIIELGAQAARLH
ncbi:MAG: hypothetical protein GC189_08140 [Alphaproteobacteria bacterium]|nr:hypothetical protein [Alphaproteobacteria bacterium]